MTRVEVDERHREAVRRMKQLVADAGLPAPDEVQHADAEVRFLWHEPRVAIVVDLQSDDGELTPIVVDRPPPNVGDGNEVQDAFVHLLRDRGADLAADRLSLLDPDEAWGLWFGPLADTIEAKLGV